MPNTDYPVSQESRVDVHIEDAVARLVLNNPRKFNAISEVMWRQIAAALDEFKNNAAIRCVVFEGDGDRAFCAGADISEKNQRARDGSVMADDPAYPTLLAIEAFPKPTIAMISGFCLGAGVALATSCDLRIANRSARFSIPAARLGLAPGFAVIKRVTDLVGAANAKRILFLADRFPAEEALRLGLVNEVVADDNLVAATRAWTAQIAANAPLTLAATKYAVETAATGSDDIDLSDYAALEQACMRSEDYKEGLRAFGEKRSPNFLGR